MRISDWSSDVCSSDLLMELHGGSLSLNSAVGSGTQAQITFPHWRLLSESEQGWTPPPPPEPAAYSAAPPPAAKPTARTTIRHEVAETAADALRSLIDTMGEGVISINPEGVVNAVRTAGAATLAYGPARVTG